MVHVSRFQAFGFFICGVRAEAGVREEVVEKKEWPATEFPVALNGRR